MKKILISTVLSAFLSVPAVFAQSYSNAWRNADVNEINRFPMHTDFIAFESEAIADGDHDMSEHYLSLDDKWFFSWYQNANEAPEDFYALDFNADDWLFLKMPAIWEVNRHGSPVYIRSGYPWRGRFDKAAPEVPVEGNSTGLYRGFIKKRPEWNGRQVIVHFGMAASCITFWLNGQFVGYAEDSRVPAEFDITPYLREGRNLYAFKIQKYCDGTYLEDHDTWRLSGIGRPSYIYTRNKNTQVEDIRINASLDDNYDKGRLTIEADVAGRATIYYTLADDKGNIVAETSELANAAGGQTYTTVIDGLNINHWTAETPYLYTLTATLKQGTKTIEVIKQRVGFRKIETKGGELLVNGQPVLLKGVNRYETDPDGGYLIAREKMIDDIKKMKAMHINAVRTTCPNDPVWYELCDEYGIYVCADANIDAEGLGRGQAAAGSCGIFDKAIVERNKHNVQWLYNHPSIICWGMGRNTTDGKGFQNAYKWIKEYDKTRPVSWSGAGNGSDTDIFSPEYASADSCGKYIANTAEGSRKPVVLAEYNRVSGNGSGGISNIWDEVRKDKGFQGGFISAFGDQTMTVRNEYGDRVLTWGDGDYMPGSGYSHAFGFASDSTLSPQAEEIKYAMQNVWAQLGDIANGQVNVYNENFFTPLKDLKMLWTLTVNGKETANGTVDDVNVGPRQAIGYALPFNASSIPAGQEGLLNIVFEDKNAAPKTITLPALPSSDEDDEFGTFAQPRTKVIIPPVDNNGHCQLQVTKYDFEAACPQPENIKKKLKVNANRGGEACVYGSNFYVGVDAATGALKTYTMNGVNVLPQDFIMQPSLWREPTDNDMLAQKHTNANAWASDRMTLTSLTTKAVKKGGYGEIVATYGLYDAGATLTVVYTVYHDGSLQIKESLAMAQGSSAKPLRLGMVATLPSAMEQSEYYGRGPSESYADRKMSQNIGLYSEKVGEQAYNYRRAQESGGKSDIRWWKQTDAQGNGLRITAPRPFFAKASKTGSAETGTAIRLNIDGAQAPLGDGDINTSEEFIFWLSPAK